MAPATSPQLDVAVAAASAGDTIIQRGGGTHSGIMFDKPLVFVGEAPRSTIQWFQTLPSLPAPHVTVSGVRMGYSRLYRQVAVEDVDF